MISSFFKKPPYREWIWMSPANFKNEFNFIITIRRHILNNISVIHTMKSGSDHRMVRGTLNINIKLGRFRQIKSTRQPRVTLI